MPQRFVPLVNGQYYHIFNRGVARLPTFTQKRDYQHFLLTLEYYSYSSVPMKLSRFTRLSIKDRYEIMTKLNNDSRRFISIISYALLPNHFHILLRQEEENGISIVLRKVQNSYTKYINIKNDRVGPLFQGAFKAVLIETEELLLHVNRYIHINAYVAHLVKEELLFSYPWSSLPQYIGESHGIKVVKETILSLFKSVS